MNNFKNIMIGALALPLIFSCTSKEHEQTESGLKYKLHTAGEGKKPATGDILTLHMIYKTDKDSILFSTYERSKPVETMLGEPSFKGGIEEGFAMLSEGDSATFWVPADSLFEKTFRSKTPDFITKGSMLTFHVKMVKFQSQEALDAETKAAAEKNRGEEKGNTEAYLKENSITVGPTPSGLYYIETQKGTGEQPANGQTVMVHYTGRFLDGKVFDSSIKSGQPLEFKLGSQMVIPGWEEGIAMMKKGGKATLVVPSQLAYGEQGATNPQTREVIIPPYAPLVFDVELVDIK